MVGQRHVAAEFGNGNGGGNIQPSTMKFNECLLLVL